MQRQIDVKRYIKTKQLFFLAILLFAVLCSGFSIAKAAPSDLVYVANVEGEIDAGLAKFIERTLDKAEREGAKAVILEINTFGGYVDAAVEIRDALIDSPIETVAFVKDRAWSAGALITLACDKIYMTSESSIGAAETRPKEEKFISAFRKEFKATAEKQGRNPDIAAAMVDSDIEIPGINPKGKLLTLTGSEALKYGMADKTLQTLKDVETEIGVADGSVRFAEMNLTDRFARIVINPLIGGLLITIGFICIAIEAATLGWGIAGTIGILALALFFSGNLLVGNTSWGLILLFVAGLILLGVEIFLIPGFGVTGITGIILALASLFLTFQNPVLGMYAISFAIVFAVITLTILAKYFGRSKVWQRIALQTSQTKEHGYLAPRARTELVGAVGEALSVLRPAGTALIDGERVDVISDGGYIQQGSSIKVVKVEGTKVIVREI